MRRIFSVVGAVVVGFTSALGLHGFLGTRATQNLVGLPSTQGSTSPTSTSTTTQGASNPNSTTTTTTTTVASTSNATVNGSALGHLENYGYGQMSVQVTVASGKIVGLKVASITTLDSYSQQLEQQVVPILKNEVLQAQGTRISALSGATYTSEAYAYSIQSALDKLHFK